MLVLAVLCGSQYAFADEGMWMINAIDKALEKNMKQRGLKLSAKEIYNADAEGATVSDAVVSMEFGCTGSMISENGLLITNHHCAYGDVHSLSTPEHNYLEEGFWAMHSNEEVNIKGKSVYYLKKVIDVTEEVNALKAEYSAKGMILGSRKLSYLMEKKYDKEFEGLECMLSSMWSGSKYYIAAYQVYKDVRLVAAPPVSSAAYGGDTDNWEWTQHKCDFAMYRVYTAPDGSPAEYSKDNVPMKPKAILKISTAGYKEGDYTMVIGYPGRTNRYTSSYENSFDASIKLPICNKLRGEQMDIIEKWMDLDPKVRLLYADYYFSLSNVQKLYGGQVQCIGRFNTIQQKENLEKELQAWIEASEERKEKWGSLLNDLKTKYLAVAPAETDVTYFRETLIRGTRFSRVLGKIMNFRNAVLVANGIKPKRGIDLLNGPDPIEEECCSTKYFRPIEHTKLYNSVVKEYENFDLRVEKELFAYAVNEYYAHVSPEMWGPYQKEVKEKYENVAEYLWNNSFLTDTELLDKFMKEEHTVAEMLGDPVYRFYKDVEVSAFNKRILSLEGEVKINTLDKEYTHALYQMRLDKGIAQYPDANSTMRLTYGTVGGFNPRNAVYYDYKTEPIGILEKYNPDNYEFHLNERQLELYRKGDWGKWGFGKGGKTLYVNFMTDNDITGGNSGSPVLNAKGELIGLAFDGNKESLASDVWYTPKYNKCICVDIRFVLWTLDCYAGMGRIIEELGL